jgi:ribosomal protein S21
MARPIQVEVKLMKDESFERLLRRFMKKVKNDRILEKYGEYRFYKKPSVKRREKVKKRMQVIRKLEREMNKK